MFKNDQLYYLINDGVQFCTRRTIATATRILFTRQSNDEILNSDKKFYLETWVGGKKLEEIIVIPEKIEKDVLGFYVFFRSDEKLIRFSTSKINKNMRYINNIWRVKDGQLYRGEIISELHKSSIKEKQ